MTEQVIIKKPVWSPNDDIEKLQDVTSGKHLEEFVEYQKIESGLDFKGAFNLKQSSCDILSYCNPHDAVTNIPTTHLVVGYVQSGKTMSFTSLIELALDLKYRIVIVLAGVTNNLLVQTDDRLSSDLLCGKPTNNKYFKIHRNPDINSTAEICRNLKLKESIVVINVLKHYDRINKITEIFEDNNLKTLLNNETVLIIDDEADQASLNNYCRANSGIDDADLQKRSSTYESILNLRNVLPANSYIQYTATPQANILISSIDMLSPKTHTLLQPGKGYCGGKLFFGKGEEGKRFGKGLIKEIPEDEVFHASVNPLVSIPKSLEEALMLHMWAVILLLKYKETDDIAQLSMMVHTDSRLEWNNTFCKWINEKLTEWSNLLESRNNNSYKSVSLFKLENELKKTLREALKFYDFDVDFEELAQYIPEVLNDCHVYLITGETDDVMNLKWNQHSMNILVGAQMLNRGFTVKNLTTTYMPRYTITVTNADTIEQRCRFFGYKEKYIRSCRVFLPKVSIENYEKYIDSEEELRMILSETKSMQECGHKILSYPRLRPTRSNVLPKDIVNTTLKGLKSLSPYNGYFDYNLNLIDTLIEIHKDDTFPFSKNGYDFTVYEGARRHTAFEIEVEEAVDLLRKFVVFSLNDRRLLADAKRYLFYLKEKGFINKVLIINMSEGIYKKRSLNSITHTLTSNLFNGPSDPKENTPHPYLGDRNMKVESTITIQLHHIEFVSPQYLKSASLAINFPESLSAKYISSES